MFESGPDEETERTQGVVGGNGLLKGFEVDVLDFLPPESRNAFELKIIVYFFVPLSPISAILFQISVGIIQLHLKNISIFLRVAILGCRNNTQNVEVTRVIWLGFF